MIEVNGDDFRILNADLCPDPVSIRRYKARISGIANHVTKEETVTALRMLARRGYGIRSVARLSGLAPNTVAKYYPRDEDVRCRCGASVFHKGWCAWRVTESPERLAYLQRWAYRSSGLLVSIGASSLLQAAAVTLRPSNVEGEMITHIDILNAVKQHAAQLEDQLKDDLIQDVFLEVLENRAPLSELGAFIKGRTKAMHGEVSKFKFISLDAVIPGTENLRLIDTIESDRLHF
jgi:hypothetical protein